MEGGEVFRQHLCVALGIDGDENGLYAFGGRPSASSASLMDIKSAGHTSGQNV